MLLHVAHFSKLYFYFPPTPSTYPLFHILFKEDQIFEIHIQSRIAGKPIIIPLLCDRTIDQSILPPGAHSNFQQISWRRNKLLSGCTQIVFSFLRLQNPFVPRKSISDQVYRVYRILKINKNLLIDGGEVECVFYLPSVLVTSFVSFVPTAAPRLSFMLFLLDYI